MDIYASELGSGIWRIEYFVRRNAAGIILRIAKKQAEKPPALDR